MTDVADRLGNDDALETAETKGERTRRRLLEIAVERFGSRGYRSTSVSEIARSAGLTQAAVYAYFDSKESLFQAAVDADASDLVNQVAARVADIPVDLLVPSVVIEAVVLVEGHPLARRVLAGQEPDEVARLVELPALHHFSDLVAERLRDAQATGEVRADLDPDLVAPGIESLVLGLLFSVIQSGGKATSRHHRGVVAAFEAMLRPPA